MMSKLDKKIELDKIRKPPTESFFKERFKPFGDDHAEGVEEDVEQRGKKQEREPKDVMERLAMKAGDLKSLRKQFYEPLYAELLSERLTAEHIVDTLPSAIEAYEKIGDGPQVNYLRRRAKNLIWALTPGREKLQEEAWELWKSERGEK